VHALDLPVEEEVQQQGLDEVVGVVAEGDLVAAQLVRIFVERPSAQARAERAERLPGLDLLLDREVDPGAPHLVGVPLARELVLDQVGPEPRESLVDVQRDEIELHRGPPLGQTEEMEQRPGVLAARHADQDPISGLDQAKVADRFAESAHEPPLEPRVFAHVDRHPPSQVARIVAPPLGHFNRPARRPSRRERGLGAASSTRGGPRLG
jgi:hypothetical protein